MRDSKEHNIKIVKGGLTFPKGFKAAGINCGLRKRKEDLGLIVSKALSHAACVFTKNNVKAAPVILSQKHVKDGRLQAIIVNSANANCCTGEEGMKHAILMADATASVLAIKKENVLVCSTGIIGQKLKIKKIIQAIPKLSKRINKKGYRAFNRSILTTDTCTKSIAVSFSIGEKHIKIGGAAKGSGMIHPDMATMLSFITTDVKISGELLKSALKKAVDNSFNMISVDGDMSTNDTVCVLANGESGNSIINKKGKNYELFVQALSFVCKNLSNKIVLDGEGATKFVTICVKGARTQKMANEIARHISISKLFKTALFGENPNWGRIAASAGSALVKFNQKDLDIYLDNVLVLSKGDVSKHKTSALDKIFKKKNIVITLDLNGGKYFSEAVTCDLSYDYVRINTEYS